MSEYQDLAQHIEMLAKADDDQQQVSLLNELVENVLDSGSIALILEAFPVEQRVRMWRSL
ncbi:magnesium transporter, partial [Vibrio diazotrophicus]|nr:magnesium transporter [Vibrio diazotrophicus]